MIDLVFIHTHAIDQLVSNTLAEKGKDEMHIINCPLFVGRKPILMIRIRLANLSLLHLYNRIVI